MKRVLTAFIYLLGQTSCAQEEERPLLQPQVATFYHSLGERQITLTVYQYGTAPGPLFLKLHDNERTAEEAARSLLRKEGGRLVVLENGGERYVQFPLKGRSHQFDPNRIFTPRGVEASLRLFRTFSGPAAAEVQGLARFLLAHLPDSLPLIALHNNTDSAFSIADYETGPLRRDARAVYRAPGSDADDFLFTTDTALFRAFEAAGLNAVLQHNENAADDGSLSIYYGRRNRVYVNAEAEYGHLAEQIRLLETVLEALRKERE